MSNSVLTASAVRAIALGALTMTACAEASSNQVGVGILVVSDDEFILCERFDPDENVCSNEQLRVRDYFALDTTQLDMVSVSDLKFSDEPVTLVQADDSGLVYTALPTD